MRTTWYCFVIALLLIWNIWLLWEIKQWHGPPTFATMPMEQGEVGECLMSNKSGEPRWTSP